MSDPNFPPPPGGNPPTPPGGGFPPSTPPNPPQGPPPGGFGAPPPPGGYGTPPPGGGGYGSPPGGFTPPPAQPYGSGGERPQLDVGSAISYGWKKFSENAGQFIVLMISVFVVAVVMAIIQNVLTPNSAGFGAMIVSLVLGGLSFIVTSIVQAGIWRAGLGVTRGIKPSFEQLTNTDNIVPYILTTILVGLGFIVGLILCIIPGIVWLIFTAYAPIIAIDKGASPGEAISESLGWVKDNFGQVFVILLVSYIVYAIGACLCGIGLLVSVPVALVAMTYSYRALNNELVTP